MQIDTAQLLTLFQLCDSMFPTGAFTHSLGLESYTQSGKVMDLPTLESLLKARVLSGGTRFEMVIIREVMHKATSATWRELDQVLTASKTAAEAREASAQVGRRFLKNALTLNPTENMQAFQEDIQTGKCLGHLPVAYGLTYGEWRFNPPEVLLAYTYQLVAGQASAAIKLFSIGQTPIQRLIHQMQPTIQQAAEQALTSTLNDCWMFTPSLDIHAMQHQYLFRRLFVS